MKLYSFFNLNCEIDISYKDTMSEKRQFRVKSLIFERVFCLSELITALYSCTPVIAVFTPHHNVGIQTFTFHKSDFHEIFIASFCKIYITSVSGCLPFTFKICEIVAYTSMIQQFHEFFESLFGVFFNLAQLCSARVAKQHTWSHDWCNMCRTTTVDLPSLATKFLFRII